MGSHIRSSSPARTAQPFRPARQFHRATLHRAHSGNAMTVCVTLPGVEAVFLMGEFNNWSTGATPMTPQGDDRWQLTLDTPVPVGTLCLFVWDIGNLFGRVIYDLPAEDHVAVEPRPAPVDLQAAPVFRPCARSVEPA